MKIPEAALLVTGSEHLRGQLTDTGSVTLAGALTRLGFRVTGKITVGDDREAIASALHKLRDISLVVILAGLGPTPDDVTVEAVARAFNLELQFQDSIWENIRGRLTSHGFAIPQMNRKQALTFRDGGYFLNGAGTAPGLYVKTPGPWIICLPGPPHEMETMWNSQVEPFLRGHFPCVAPATLEWFIFGAPESLVAEKLEPFLKQYPGLDCGTYAKYYEIRIQLYSNDPDFPAGQLEKANRQLPSVFKGIGLASPLNLPNFLGQILTEKQMTLSVAESLTGGLLSHFIVSASGASRYFKGSLTAYSNSVKERMLGIDPQVLHQHGAVSEAVASCMVDGACRVFDSQAGIALTGIAGPGGGTDQKPVGLVYAGLKVNNHSRVLRYQFKGSRSLIQERAVRRSCFDFLKFLNELDTIPSAVA